MGEYAIRKCDKQEIKIGTCESMYYMTFAQWARGEVIGGDTPHKKILKHINFRLPRADEQDILPGDFEEPHAQPIELFLKAYKHKETGKLEVTPEGSYYEYEESEFTKEIREICIENKGIIQVEGKMTFPRAIKYSSYDEKTGIIANIPCYHGFTSDLPKGFFYNGFNSHVLAVMTIAARIRDGKYKACAIIGCRACGRTIFSITKDELKENFWVTTSNEVDFYYLLNELDYMQMWLDKNMEG